MFEFLKNLFAKPPADPPERIFGKRDRQDVQPQEGMRRWDSAETTRLNAKQWCAVGHMPQSINRDMFYQRSVLVGRARHERYNNPMVEGICETYAIDVLGKDGPTLIVESESEDWNQAFGELWQNHFDSEGFEVTGLTGVQLMQRLIVQDFTSGDWTQQIVNIGNQLPSGTILTNRLLDFDPERLKTPFMQAGDKWTMLGIRRDRLGRPVQYFVADPADQFANWDNAIYAHRYQAYSPDDIIHEFYSREPGQIRGFPRLASVLQEIADLRDYDNQVLDAARAAANNGFLLYTELPELIETAAVFEGSMELERQVAKAIPPGYKATQMHPAQPVAQYVSYRHEKLRSLGRLVHMPLLSILLSAEGSNFSQSRIDLNVLYERGLNNYRRQRCEPWLKRTVQMADMEARFATTAGGRSFAMPPRPENVSYSFYWPPMGQANPKDHVAAQDMRLRLGLTTYEEELARENKKMSEVIRRRSEINQELEAANLPPVPPVVDQSAQMQAEETETNDNNNREFEPVAAE